MDTVNVSGFDDGMVQRNLPIGTSATKVFDSNGRPYILIENEQIDHTTQENSIMSTNQVRAFGVDVDDCPSRFTRNGVPGRQSMICTDGIEIPFDFDGNLILLPASAPTDNDLRTLPYLVITSGSKWNPLQDMTMSQGTWTPLPKDDLGIVNTSAHQIVSERLTNCMDIHNVRTDFDDTNGDILDENIDLPGLIARHDVPSDDDWSDGESDSDEDMPELQARDVDSSDEEDLDSDDESEDESPPHDPPYFDQDLFPENEFEDDESEDERPAQDPPYIEFEDDDAVSIISTIVSDVVEYTEFHDEVFKVRFSDDEYNQLDVTSLYNQADYEPDVDLLKVPPMYNEISISNESEVDSLFSEEESVSSMPDLRDTRCDNSSEDDSTECSWEMEVDDDLTLSSFDKAGSTPLTTATVANVMQYISRCANVKAAKGPRPRNKVLPADKDWNALRRKFAFVSEAAMKATFLITTQLGSVDIRYPMRRHFRSRLASANVNRIHETFSTDTMFASVTAIGGETCIQIFVGNTSSLTAIYGMKREGEGLGTLEQFVTDWGAPDAIRRDNSKMQNSAGWKAYERKMQIKSELSEPHNQQQNPAERRIQTIKSNTNQIMDHTGTPTFMWFECVQFVMTVLNMVAMDRLKGRNAIEVALGHSVDISAYIAFEWWERVYYLDYEEPSFPTSREKHGYFCGVAENCGDLLTFKIYVPETHVVIHRSVLRSASSDDDNPNLRAMNPHYDGILKDDDVAPDPMDVEDAADPKPGKHLSGANDAPDDFSVSLDYEPVLSTRNDHPDGDAKLVDATTNSNIPDPVDLMGFSFPMEHNKITQKATVMEHNLENENFVIELMDGSKHLVEYNFLIDKYNATLDESDQLYTFSSLLNHRKKKGRWEVLINWDVVGSPATWEPLKYMRDADPITCAQYAKDHNLISLPGWKWADKVRTMDSSRMLRTARRILKGSWGGIKHKFGVQVPRTVREAYELDRRNGNSLWKKATEKEINQLLEFNTFKVLARNDSAPNGYTRVPLIIVYDVKHDGRRKCRQVAGGHVTEAATEDVYSSVVTPEGVRIVIYLAEDNGLKVWGGDVGNAYLNGTTREKIYVVLGQEYGPELEGRVAIVVKSFYGLKTSCARWSEHLADTLRALGWVKSKALNDVWMKDCGSHYEYLAVYSDDIIVASKDPKRVYDTIQETYTMKGVGAPEYFLGAACGREKGQYTDTGSTTTLSAKVFIQNIIPRLEEELGVLRSYTVPMDPEYRPELDETHFLGANDLSKFRMLTGSAQWAITLERIDICYACTMMSRYNMCAREGHLLAMKKLFGYLKCHNKGKILFDTRPLLIKDVELFDGGNWKQTYGDVKEAVPDDLPEQKMKAVKIVIYFDASFACDMVTRRSITGIIVFVNGTPIRWYCKQQNTVESSTYGAEFVAGRIATEMAIELRYTFRMLGVPIDGPVLLLGDNRGMIQNASMMSSQLKKKHNAIAYHRVRECVAANIIQLGFVRSENNFADICTKALNGPKIHRFTKDLLFRTSDSGECQGESNPVK